MVTFFCLLDSPSYSIHLGVNLKVKRELMIWVLSDKDDSVKRMDLISDTTITWGRLEELGIVLLIPTGQSTPILNNEVCVYFLLLPLPCVNMFFKDLLFIPKVNLPILRACRSTVSLPEEPLLSMDQGLSLDDNEKQDLATILFRLLTYQEDSVPLSKILPGLQLPQGEVVVKKPHHHVISKLHTIVDSVRKLRIVMSSGPASCCAYLNGQKASFADGWCSLELVSEMDPWSSVLLVVQSKRKETYEARNAPDTQFQQELEKAVLGHFNDFKEHRILPIFVYITDANGLSSEQTAFAAVVSEEYYCCIITSASHQLFYGKYRTILRDFKNAHPDDPLQGLRKLINTDNSPEALMERIKKGEKLSKARLGDLQEFCRHFGVDFEQTDTISSLKERIFSWTREGGHIPETRGENEDVREDDDNLMGVGQGMTDSDMLEQREEEGEEEEEISFKPGTIQASRKRRMELKDQGGIETGEQGEKEETQVERQPKKQRMGDN
jgi:hypothetical protein